MLRNRPDVYGALTCLKTHPTIERKQPMIDLFRKTLYTGIGLAVRTQNEIIDLAKDLAEQNKLSETEGKKFIDEVVDKYNETKKRMNEQIEASVKKILSSMQLATQAEVDALKKEIKALKERLPAD